MYLLWFIFEDAAFLLCGADIGRHGIWFPFVEWSNGMGGW